MRPGQEWEWRLGKAQADLGVVKLGGSASAKPLCLEAPPYSLHFLAGPPKSIRAPLQHSFA